MAQTFMVTGATGYQGGSLARDLVSQNHKVHALVRDPSSEKAQALEKLGVIIFKGSFDNVDVIKAATAGTSGVFLNPFPTPMNPDLQIQHAKNVINVAVAEQCPLVLSTAFLTADQESWKDSGPQDFLYLYYSRKFAIEAEIRAAGLKSYSIIRPAYLMHNYLLPFSYFHYPDLPKSGVLKHIFEGDGQIAHLDSADIGKIAAVILQSPNKYDKLEIDLAVENFNAEEALAVIKKVSKREDLRTEKVYIEKFDPMAKTGLTWHYFANNQNTKLANGSLVEKIFGVRLTTFAEYLEREKPLLMASLPALPNRDN